MGPSIAFDGDAPKVRYGAMDLPSRFSITTSPRDTGDGSPVAKITVMYDGQRWVCDEVVLVRTPGGRPCRVSDLRGLPLTKLLAGALESIAWGLKSAESAAPTGPAGEVIPFHPGGATVAGQVRAQYERNALRAPRRPLTDDHLRFVAKEYRRFLEEGRYNPIVLIAKEMGVPRWRARHWVEVAREKRFLGPAVGTRAGEARGGRPRPDRGEVDGERDGAGVVYLRPSR